MATPDRKRPRLAKSIPLKNAIDLVLETTTDNDSEDNIPDVSDDENLSDEGGEDYVPSQAPAESSSDEADDEGDEESTDLSTQSGSSRIVRTWKWVKKDMPPSERPTNELIARGPATTAKTPQEMFSVFFDDMVMDNILLETNRKRTVSKRNVSPVSLDELRVFLGICLYMSIVDLPFRRMYWSPQTRQNDVADNMTCNRFEEILSLLHLNDNELMEERGHPHHDQLFRVRPLLTQLNMNFERSAEKENCIAVDEMIIPFKGRHSLKVYMMKKPKKWGYKVWVHAGQSGYVHKLLFAGDNVLKSDEDLFERVGRAGQVVLLLSQGQPQGSHVFFDNYFASPDLLSTLKERSLNATCTIRANRTRQCPLLTQKEMKKKGRGGFDFRMDEDQSVIICEWFDNKIVTVASNVEGVQPTHKVRRYDRKAKKHIEVSCPGLIKTYNENMGGVDKADMLLALYRITLKTRQWYKRIFFHLLDLAVVNSWLLYRASRHECQIQLAMFKLAVARALICSKRVLEPLPQSKLSNVSVPSKSVCEDVRFDRVDHFLKKMDVKFAQRCKLPGCSRKTKYLCRKCSVYLCIDSKGEEENCFFLYHHRS